MGFPEYVMGSFNLETQALPFCEVFILTFFDNFFSCLFWVHTCYIFNLYWFSGFLSIIFSIFSPGFSLIYFLKDFLNFICQSCYWFLIFCFYVFNVSEVLWRIFLFLFNTLSCHSTSVILSIFFPVGWFSVNVWLSDLGLSLSNEEWHVKSCLELCLQRRDLSGRGL